MNTKYEVKKMNELFPIMGIDYRHGETVSALRKAGVMFAVVAVPWEMMAPHERQADLNHSQTLKRLAERGGLSPTEAIAVIEGKRWRDLRGMTDTQAHRRLHEYVQQHLDKKLEWAVSRWKEEVENRPLSNVHRRSLDDVWRQVIRYSGGDPVELCGPAHDDLLLKAREDADNA